MKKILFIVLAIILEIIISLIAFYYLVSTTPSKSGPGTVMDGFGDLFYILFQVLVINIFYIVGCFFLYKSTFHPPQSPL